MSNIRTPPMNHSGPFVQPLAVDENTAAEMLGVSVRTFWEWRKNGDIPHIKLGRLVRYAVDDLKLFLHHKREETNAQLQSAMGSVPCATDDDQANETE